MVCCARFTRPERRIDFDLDKGNTRMLYQAYELQRNWMNSVSSIAAMGSEMLSSRTMPFGYSGFAPMAANALDVIAHATAAYDKPRFGARKSVV